MSRLLTAALFCSWAVVAAPSLTAQTSMPPNQVTHFTDTLMLKPPPGVKVAILEWEDLECPACAKAFPIVHEAAKHYNIPIVRRDFPLTQIHVWSPKAAVYARFMQDKISPELAEEYRRQVFASQFRISSVDDMNKFTQDFLKSHGQQMPFVVDPTGQFAKEVDADKALGEKLGLSYTPTIIVATKDHWIEVKDVMQLYAAIDQAEAETAKTSTPATHRTTATHR